MVRRAAIILLALACCSCGLMELRGHDAFVREENARIICEEVENLRSSPTMCSTSAEQAPGNEHLDRIKERALDEIQRSKVAQKDYGYTPKEAVDPESQEADNKFNERAGRVQARDAKRRILKELPGRIARGAVKVAASFIPAPVRTIIKAAFYIALVTVLATLLFWVWRKMRYFRKSTFEAIQGVAKMPKEQRKDIFGDKLTLKQVFKKNGIS